MDRFGSIALGSGRSAAVGGSTAVLDGRGQHSDPMPCFIRTGSECLVVIPTYNERENIAALIHALRALDEPLDVLVVDDNSPDGTAEIVRELMARHDGIYLLQRSGKQGLGTAYRAGFTFALQHGWQYICQMDADFSHDPQAVLDLLALCRSGADVAVGSRYVGGGRTIGWPWRRRLLSRGANLCAQVLLHSRLTDMTGGFKCFTRSALQQIDLARISSQGYIFQVEMNHRAEQHHLTIKQHPIHFTDRRHGTSKMGIDEARGGLKQLIRLARRTH